MFIKRIRRKQCWWFQNVANKVRGRCNAQCPFSQNYVFANLEPRINELPSNDITYFITLLDQSYLHSKSVSRLRRENGVYLDFKGSQSFVQHQCKRSFTVNARKKPFKRCLRNNDYVNISQSTTTVPILNLLNYGKREWWQILIFVKRTCARATCGTATFGFSDATCLLWWSNKLL